MEREGGREGESTFESLHSHNVARILVADSDSSGSPDLAKLALSCNTRKNISTHTNTKLN